MVAVSASATKPSSAFICTSPEPSVIYSPNGKIARKKLENPTGFWNNVGDNTSSLFQHKGAFE
jgi:hypothetical protein